MFVCYVLRLFQISTTALRSRAALITTVPMRSMPMLVRVQLAMPRTIPARNALVVHLFICLTVFLQFKYFVVLKSFLTFVLL